MTTEDQPGADDRMRDVVTRDPTDEDSAHADTSRRGVDDAPQLEGSESASQGIDEPDDEPDDAGRTDQRSR